MDDAARLGRPPAPHELGLGPRVEDDARRPVESARDDDLAIGLELHRGLVHRARPHFFFVATIGLLLLFELFDELVQFLEARIPELAIALEPVVQLAQRLRAQLVEPLLRARLHVDEPGLLQHAQVLRDLRLVELQALADVVHRARPGAQQLDDAEAVGLGERGERFDHRSNMPMRHIPVKAYT